MNLKIIMLRVKSQTKKTLGGVGRDIREKDYKRHKEFGG